MVGQSSGIRAIQRGTFSLNNSNTTDTISISEVVNGKAVVTGGAPPDSTTTGVHVYIPATTAIRWTRNTGSPTTTFIPPYEVIERY